MEGYMVISEFDNTNGISGKDAIDLIKNYFQSNLNKLTLIEEYVYSGYWGVKYSYQGVLISISCDRGGLETFIIIDEKEFPLWQFDRGVINASIASKKNILFVLDVINRFFEVTS
jgi:hypothetical protein